MYYEIIIDDTSQRYSRAQDFLRGVEARLRREVAFSLVLPKRAKDMDTLVRTLERIRTYHEDPFVAVDPEPSLLEYLERCWMPTIAGTGAGAALGYGYSLFIQGGLKGLLPYLQSLVPGVVGGQEGGKSAASLYPDPIFIIIGTIIGFAVGLGWGIYKARRRLRVRIRVFSARKLIIDVGQIVDEAV